jgi:hypothetical protein
MEASRWQKQHIHFERNIWVISGIISVLLISILLALGFTIEMAGVFFILVFVLLRVSLAFIFKNRYGNSLVRVLKYEYEELEHDFRMVFKHKNVRFYRQTEEDAYIYEFPGRNGLTMTVQPHFLSYDREQPATKLTLQLLNAKNTAFAETLAEAIDEIVDQRTNSAQQRPQPT